MSSAAKTICFLVALASFGSTAHALSEMLSSPEIRFPQGFDQKKSDAIEEVLQDPRFKYVDGLYSHWPPAWSTTLTYAGNSASAQAMVDRLARIPGIHVQVTFVLEGLSPGGWSVRYSHEKPDTIAVQVNLAGDSATRPPLQKARIDELVAESRRFRARLGELLRQYEQIQEKLSELLKDEAAKEQK